MLESRSLIVSLTSTATEYRERTSPLDLSNMPGSGLLGQKPITQNDHLIAKALRLESPTTLTPDKRYPLGPPLPPKAPHDSRAPGMIVGQCFAIFFVIAITSTRLYIRRRRKAIGLDDWAIIPAAVCRTTSTRLRLFTFLDWSAILSQRYNRIGNCGLPRIAHMGLYILADRLVSSSETDTLSYTTLCASNSNAYMASLPKSTFQFSTGLSFGPRYPLCYRIDESPESRHDVGRSFITSTLDCSFRQVLFASASISSPADQ